MFPREDATTSRSSRGVHTYGIDGKGGGWNGGVRNRKTRKDLS